MESVYAKEPELAWEDLRFNLEMVKQICRHKFLCLHHVWNWGMVPESNFIQFWIQKHLFLCLCVTMCSLHICVREKSQEGI